MKLLSGKSLSSFEATEYKEYVRGLKIEPPPKKTRVRVSLPFKWKFTKTGQLSVTFNKRLRPKPWLSREEIEQIAKECGWATNTVWVSLCNRKRNPISVSDQESVDMCSEEKNPLPW